MAMEDICSPAIIYIAFSFVHILIDIFKNLYNDALVKFVIMLVFTTVLNILCQRGLGVVSWFIVFIPFITMTLLSHLVLLVLSENSNNEGKQSNIDEINYLRSNKNNEPIPTIEFSNCNAMACNPGISSDDYMIDTNIKQDTVTDIEKLKFDTINCEDFDAQPDAPASDEIQDEECDK